MGILNRPQYDEFCRLRKLRQLPAGVRTFSDYLEFLERTVSGFSRDVLKGNLSQSATGESLKKV